MKQFKSIIEFLTFYSDEQKCKDTLELQLYPKGIHCPHCQAKTPYRTNRGFTCSNKLCHKKFSIITNTVFENSNIKLSKWFAAIYLSTSHKKGISSHQLAKDINTTQKTAWFMLQRIREMLKQTSPQLLTGTVEVDETYYGGKAVNKHKHQRKEMAKKGTGYVHRSPVIAMVQRGGTVLTMVVPGNKVDGTIMKPLIRQHIDTKATLISDGHGSYYGLHKEYHHEIIQHAKDEFVRGSYHTNTVENFFSHLKRGLQGIQHHVSPKHLHRYCQEYAFRFNTRKRGEFDRFALSLSMALNKRLKYCQLIANV